jgi:hypothetical protein
VPLKSGRVKGLLVDFGENAKLSEETNLILFFDQLACPERGPE